jgi:branched-chain amino acid aminotransferase
MPNPPYTWMNGAVVPWQDSRIHINTDVVLRGASVFEGIRAYRAAEGGDLRLFRAAEHLRRLLGTSARVLHLDLPYTVDDLRQATLELLRANDIREHAHIRVVAYFDEPELGDGGDTTGAFILAFPRPHGTRLRSGIRSMVSAWRRPSDVSLPPRVKASGSYLNGRLAIADARSKGFDIPILLNEAGKVSEGPGQNLFLVRDGVLVTPRVSDAILEGITRRTVLRLASDHGIPVQERAVDATELYVADELFFAGTLIEIQPIVVVDSYVVGSGTMGPLTERIQDLYLATVTGRRDAPPEWFTSVYGAADVWSTVSR